MALSAIMSRYQPQLAAVAVAAAAYGVYRASKQPVLAQPRAVAAAAAPGGEFRVGAREFDEAWGELNNAVSDASRHAEYTAGVLRGAAGETDAARVQAALGSVALDARAHAVYVASEVRAFGELAGVPRARLPPIGVDALAGPPSSSQLDR